MSEENKEGFEHQPEEGQSAQPEASAQASHAAGTAGAANADATAANTNQTASANAASGEVGASNETSRIWNPYQQQPGAAAEERQSSVETQNTQAAQAGYRAYQQSQGASQYGQGYQTQTGYQAYQPYSQAGSTQGAYTAPNQTAQGQTIQGQTGSYGAPYSGQATQNTQTYAQGSTQAYQAQQAPSNTATPKKKRGFKKPQFKSFGKSLSTTTKTALAGFVGALIACAIFAGGSTLMGHSTSNTVTLGGSGSTVTASDTDASLAEQVAAKASPSVVSVTTYVNKQTASGIGSKSSSSLTQYSSGSGVIISSEGYIVTNYHVIESSSKVTVSVGDKEYDAEVTGTDQSSDLAVLKIDASDLTAIEIGSSSDLNVGEWCMTVGSAFGLGKAVSSGIVSATNCTYDELNDETGSAIYANMIQTDAAANPGNSGGALVDSDGKFIGVVTMGVTYSGDNSGVNFAIPVDYVMNIAQQIIEGKTPSHAQLGVTMTTINSQLSDYYGLAVSEGAYVSSVSSKSGADKAGIKEGDIITAVDGNKASSAMDVILAIRSHSSGDTLKVTVNRDGSEQTFDVTLGSDS